MSTKEKLLIRLKATPSDFTYRELKKALKYLGYEEVKSGKTTGSHGSFYSEATKDIIYLAKPHPKKEFGLGTIKAIVKQLEEKGII